MRIAGKHEPELRAAILEQANKLFKIFGYHKLVMEDIARAVGKKRTTLYIYFKDKEAIFSAIIKKEIDAYLDELLKDLPNHSTAGGKLNAYFQIKMSFRHAKATQYLTLNEELTREPEMMNKMRVITDPPEIEHLTKIITQGVADGEFIMMDGNKINLLVHMLISSLHGIANDVLAHAETADVEPVRELLSSIFVQSLVKR